MTTTLTPSPIMQFFDANGNPLVGGKLFTYAAGTTTPQATYTDYTGGTANTNPVIFNSRGEAAVWCGNSRYYMELKDANDTLIWTADNVNGANGPTLALLAASNGATLIGYTPTDTNVAETVNSRLQLLDGVSPTTTGTDGNTKASINAFRDASAVAGGTVGYVNPTVYARTVTGATETSFEWTNLAIMDNYAAAGENVALYGQGNKRSTGPTWGIVSEARDFTQVANPTKGLIGIEVGLFANGTDTGFQRVGVDVSVGKGVAGGTINTTTYGVRVGPTNNDLTEGQVTDGIALNGNMAVGVQVSSSGTWGIQISGTYTVGLDLGTSTNSTSAIRIKNGDNMAFDASSVYRLRHNSTGVAGLTYSVSGTDSVILSDAGGIVLGETIAWTSAYAFTSATAGTNGAPPAQVGGYIKVNVNGVFVKVPYYGL
jgi:hypothetical protein